jgi:glycosyltransferase involved in cell wall biosynthesis
MPRVTVVTATYNWAEVLPYAIGSVLDQTFADFELLVIGDGCSDASAEVVASVGDERVHWYNLLPATGHQWGPNNEGIRRARGEVIAYLGHDDIWLPHHLDVMLDAIDAGARIAHATTLYVTPAHAPHLSPPAGWSYAPGAGIPPTTLVHDRAVGLEAGGWRGPQATGSRMPDTDLWARIAAAGHPPLWVPRLTSVKLPARTRRDVYRDRPHHEQAYWLERIRAAADPEAELRAAAGRSYPFAVESPRGIWAAVRHRLRPRTRLRKLGPVRRVAGRGPAEQRLRAARRHKGL